MNTYTVTQVCDSLRKECIAAPLNPLKIIHAFKYNKELAYQALNMFIEGKLDNYLMFPSHKYLIF